MKIRALPALSITTLMVTWISFPAAQNANVPPKEEAPSSPVVQQDGASDVKPPETSTRTADATKTEAKKTVKPARLSAGLAEIVKMVEGGVEAPVIESYIQSSNIPFYPTVEEIIYLHELGVPSQIVTAMIRRGGEVRAQLAQASKDAQNRITQQQQQTAPSSTAGYAQSAPASVATPPVTHNYYVAGQPSCAVNAVNYPIYTYYPAYSACYVAPAYPSYYYRRPHRSYYYPIVHDSFYPRFHRYGAYPNYGFSSRFSFAYSSPVRTSFGLSIGRGGRAICR